MFSGILVDKAKDLKAASVGLVKAEEELSELWESQSPQQLASPEQRARGERPREAGLTEALEHSSSHFL